METNSLVEDMACALEATKTLTEITDEIIFNCLIQVAEDQDSTLWSKLRGRITEKVESTLHQEINELMKDVDGDWEIQIEMESAFDDNGSFYNYPAHPYLNDDMFPVSMSGDFEMDEEEFQEEWLVSYPSLDEKALEKLVYKLELLYDEINQGYVLNERELRRV